MVVISRYFCRALNAGPKAKIDVERILNKEFNAKIKTYKLKKVNDESKFEKIKRAIFTLKNVKKNEITVIQFPYSNVLPLTKRAKNKIAFIHDLEGLRTKDEELEKKEIAFLKTCKYVVAHNDIMKRYLIDRGIQENKILVLELFDYLCNEPNKNNDSFVLGKKIELIYTGNLDKAAFIKQIQADKINFNLNVYGICNETIKNEKIIYKGKYLPEELAQHLEGDLGLVWDGNLDDSDENEGFKNYTKFNNPHKLSCYIAAGKPVVVWKKSAVAKFVQKHNIGYVISNLYDVNNIDFSDYKVKMKNIEELELKVREGYFTKKVINQIIEREKRGNS